jgi:acetyl-CoA carboxylase biotin carboxyl carrier protein
VSLTAKDVAEITRLLEESSFDELYLELDGLKLSLKRTGAQGTPLVEQTMRASVPPPAEALRATADATAPEVVAGAADQSVEEVVAPLLGTFYRAPKPGAPAFVDVGSRVEEDTIVGIIEVMKLMNTVRAAVRGTVTEVLARDGALVEYGETLLRVRKTSEP